MKEREREFTFKFGGRASSFFKKKKKKEELLKINLFRKKRKGKRIEKERDAR